MTGILDRWTPLSMAFPGRHIVTGPEFEAIDLTEWSANVYDYDADPYHPVVDYLTPPEAMLDGAKGDCEDYAFFAASVLASKGVEDIDLVSMLKWGTGHVVAEANGKTYSSGTVHDMTAGEFAKQNGYLLTLRRPSVGTA